MKLKSPSGVVLYGAGILAGALALADLALIFLPKIRPLGSLIEILELYLERLHPAFKGGIGGGVGAQLVVAVVLAWVATYAAIESFSRRTDGVSLWRNLAHDSCGRRPDGIRKTICASIKWIITLTFGPVLIVYAMLLRLRTGTKAVTVGYITVAPSVILEYIKHLLIGLAVVVTLVLALQGRLPEQHGYGVGPAALKVTQMWPDRR